MKVRVWCATAGSFLLASAIAPAAAHAESSFTAISSATAVDVTVANEDLPLVQVLQAAGPSAGTSLDSTGQGTAFASDPYPGTTVAELPATVATLTGLPVPPYPFFVATTSDDEPADYTQPGLELHATCRVTRAPGCTASSLAGTTPLTTQARSLVRQPSPDEVVATAWADTEDLTLPGDVTLSGTHTSATVSLKDGVLVRRSELSVARLTVGETQAFSIQDGKVLVAGSEVPVPFATLASALGTAGVEAELIAASQSRYGVVAPVLRLRTLLPGGPAVLTKPTTVVFTFGGADASVTLGAFLADGRPGGSFPDDSRGPAKGSTPTGALAPSSSLVGADPASLPGVGPAGSGAEPTVAPQLAQATPASSPAQPFDVAEIYLAVVLCGVVWFGATQALRVFGVRFRWTS
ncbi:MAG: hypothetical protein M3P04_04155 [Actinomycetota bacterium]|nr:hypothetical protein [Actinomycetota bacterium]